MQVERPVIVTHYERDADVCAIGVIQGIWQESAGSLRVG